ncbi:MAG: TraB/GumN family protein [Clostridia bacterium]|nr:TraB/GumN family protein [Clostridia bacterium]
MTKKLLAVFLAFVLCFGMFGCEEDTIVDRKSEISVTEKSTFTPSVTETAETEPSSPTPGDTETTVPVSDEDISGESSPILYKVTDTNGNVLWLFGSIHVGREDYYPLPDYVLDAFESSDALAVEFDTVSFENDLGSQIKALQMLMYTDGTTIKDHISAEVYSRAVEILEENTIYNSMMDYYLPSLWANFIDNCAYEKIGANSELGIDLHFIERAMDCNKEILEIESAEFQFGMLGGFSEELQVCLLEGSIESYEYLDEMKEEVNVMMDLWASGDEKKFSEYLNSEEDIADPQEALLYKEYNDAMMVSRNAEMTKYAENALKSGKEVFICVGAAHIVGDGAIAEELRLLGYTVERVKRDRNMT